MFDLNMFNYEILIDGVPVHTSEYAGLTHLKYESARMVHDNVVLRRVYVGDDYDPVLHSTMVYDPEIGGWVTE